MKNTVEKMNNQLIDLPADTILHLLNFYGGKNSKIGKRSGWRELFGYFSYDKSRTIHLLFNHIGVSISSIVEYSKIPLYNKMGQQSIAQICREKFIITPNHYISFKTRTSSKLNNFDLQHIKNLTSVGNWRIVINVNVEPNENWICLLKEWQDNQNIKLKFLLADSGPHYYGDEEPQKHIDFSICMNFIREIVPKANIIFWQRPWRNIQTRKIPNPFAHKLIIDMTNNFKLLKHFLCCEQLEKLQFVFTKIPSMEDVGEYHQRLDHFACFRKFKKLTIHIFPIDGRLIRNEIEKFLPKLIRVFKSERLVLKLDGCLELVDEFFEECLKSETLKSVESVGNWDPYEWKAAKSKLGSKLKMISAGDYLLD